MAGELWGSGSVAAEPEVQDFNSPPSATKASQGGLGPAPQSQGEGKGETSSEDSLPWKKGHPSQNWDAGTS